MSPPMVVSLFSGAGGLDHGLEAAGFRVAVATDFDHDSCETLRGLDRFEVVEGDILDERQVSAQKLLRVAEAQASDVDLLVGGPPCQPFSKSGYWARGDSGRLSDPRASTLSAYLKMLEETQPKAFLLENVDGLAYSGKSEGLDLLLREIDGINQRTHSRYAPSYKVLNAADFGVPQVRRRLFVIAARDGTPFSFPKSVASAARGEKPRRASDGTVFFRCAWDALADAHVDDEDLTVRGKWAGLLPSIPEGQNYLYHTDRGEGLPLFGWRRRYWGFLLKLAKNRPSWTIQAQPGPAIGPFHWDNRRLSRHELCRLQTFPDHVKVAGGRVSVQRQVGNAVPSLLTEILGRAIRTQLLGLPAVEGPLLLLPPLRSDSPAPTPALDVPAEYLSLKGEHEAHPGTGLGAGAKRRIRADVELIAASA